MSIDTTKPSRELDAAVARAMGWTDIKKIDVKPNKDTGDTLAGLEDGVRMFVAPYSREPSPALYLIQTRFIDKGYQVSITASADYWNCELTGPSYGYGIAKTLPLAICLAALKAVGS